MSYNRFQYWIKGPRHRKLDKRHPIEKRIENGDYEYPTDVLKDLNNQRKSLENRIAEYREVNLRKGLREESILEGIEHAFKKTRVTIKKVEEELLQEEERRLEEFREAAFKALYPYMDQTIKQNLWDAVIEESIMRKDIDSRINNTMDFYIEYKNRLLEYIENCRETTVEKIIEEQTVEKIVR